MAISHLFNGKIIKLPGAYAETKALIGMPVYPASYSKVAIIDTGSNAGWGSGSGIAGENKQSKNSIYKFSSAPEMQAFVKGGPWFALAPMLFQPSRIRQTNGVSEVHWIGAKQTTAPVIDINLTNCDFQIKTLDEGPGANGVYFIQADGTQVLTTGYGMTIIRGVRDTTKYIFQFWVGTFTGLNPQDNMPYNEMWQSTARPDLVAQSKEVSTLGDLIQWMQTDYNFGLGFRFPDPQDPMVGGDPASVFTDADLISDQEMILAVGGTEIYNPSHITEALAAISTTDCSFLLSDQYGAQLPDTVTNPTPPPPTISVFPTYNQGVLSAINSQYQYFCENESRFKLYLVLAGGRNKDEYMNYTRIPAQFYNSDYVWMIHGGVGRVSALANTRIRLWDSLAHACLILGRIAGTLPQVPPTFKEIDIVSLEHEMTKFEMEDCLDAGVLTSYYDEDMERFNILKGVNTLQNNSRLVNPDGTTPAIQVRRIAEQVNKEIIIDAKKELFTQREGVTLTSLSMQFVKDWIGVKLKQKIDRELIVDFDNIQIMREQDAYYVSYEFRPNYEINFLFATGFLLE